MNEAVDAGVCWYFLCCGREVEMVFSGTYLLGNKEQRRRSS